MEFKWVKFQKSYEGNYYLIQTNIAQNLYEWLTLHEVYDIFLFKTVYHHRTYSSFIWYIIIKKYLYNM